MLRDNFPMSFLWFVEAGRLMARYCIAFETMKKFCKISGVESICELVSQIY